MPERTNQSLIATLRKHAEMDKLNWNKWLDFVLFAYRTSVHTTTSYTPFELLFGRKANGFEDWKSTKDDTQTLELELRGNEIE